MDPNATGHMWKRRKQNEPTANRVEDLSLKVVKAKRKLNQLAQQTKEDNEEVINRAKTSNNSKERLNSSFTIRNNTGSVE